MKRTLLAVTLAAATVGLAACSSAGAGTAKPTGPHPEWRGLTLTVGQQASGIVTLAKESGAFADTPYQVKWALFPYGPPLVAAASSGQVDIGDVGAVPPITGAAKNLGFKIVAAEKPIDPATQAADDLLVPKDSPIRTLADLRGKKVAVPIGSSAHGFLLNAIQSVGLTPKDVTFVNLAPGPGAAAFDSGKVDAWAIWQPQVAIEQAKGARVLLAGHPPYDYGTSFYVASTKALDDPVRRAAVTDLLKRLAEAYQWGDDHIAQWRKAVEQETQVPPSISAITVPNGRLQVRYVTPQLIAAEQKLADDFYDTGQITERIDAVDVVENLLSPNFATT
ncbi:MAG: aliphatic sulfonate ABC transporter substrate-binding protein [Actinobacteria bacterium]|nr:aliphatic sulfonate ABC transporter substrate-binding protein [Actinomycetota bacterium]